MNPYAMEIDFALQKLVKRCRAHEKFLDDPVNVLMAVANEIREEAWQEPKTEAVIFKVDHGRSKDKAI